MVLVTDGRLPIVAESDAVNLLLKGRHMGISRHDRRLTGRHTSIC